MVVRNEARASITFDPANGKISAEVKGAFGDASGSLFGVFDLQSMTYVPFSGPGAALDRFVQLGDGSRVFTLKDNGRGGDLFAIDVAARTSADPGKSLRDIGILPAAARSSCESASSRRRTATSARSSASRQMRRPAARASRTKSPTPQHDPRGGS